MSIHPITMTCSAWTANASFGTPLQTVEPMLVDLGSVSIVVPIRTMKAPEECPEKSLGNLPGSNYSLLASVTSRLVPFGSVACFDNPTSYKEPTSDSACLMDVAYAGGEFVGPMITDNMSVDGQNLTVNFAMPMKSFDCSLSATRLLGMNQGKSSFLSQAYNGGYVDETLVGFCGGRGINGSDNSPFMVLGSGADLSTARDASSIVKGIQAFPLFDGEGLASLEGYDDTFMSLAKNRSVNKVEKEHYYTVVDSIQVGNDSFGTVDQVRYVAMIDSGWTTLGLYRPMIESLTALINQTLIENDLDDDISLLLNPDQPSPKGCVFYNASMYSDPAALAKLMYPTISVTLQGRAKVTIELAETAAFYGKTKGLDIMCANLEEMKENDPIMLGTPFFIDRYIQLNPNKKEGHFTDIVECDQVKTALKLRNNQDDVDDTASEPQVSETSLATRHTIWVACLVAFLGQVSGWSLKLS